MYHYVYILKTLDGYKNRSYVGYSTNVYERLKKHNLSKGAKATRGYKWKIIYKRTFRSKEFFNIFPLVSVIKYFRFLFDGLKFLQILTPRLDPSLTGLTTIGNFIFFFFFLAIHIRLYYENYISLNSCI